MKPRIKNVEIENISRGKLRRRSFISYGIFIGLNVLGWSAWRWLYHSPREKAGITGGARGPLRNALYQNEKIFSKSFSHNHLVKTYPKSMAAKNVRVNSDIGMKASDVSVETWTLTIKTKDGKTKTINLEEIKRLPKSEIVYDFKCVEGWDQVSWWGGAKFSDFIAHYKLEDQVRFGYIGLTTPDGGYYVGIDMPSAMHPQTILAYEVNGQPLPDEHGYPLRLIIPVKYGIKNLKRIGSLTFSNEQPPDYWAERGYDYYSGL